MYEAGTWSGEQRGGVLVVDLRSTTALSSTTNLMIRMRTKRACSVDCIDVRQREKDTAILHSDASW